MFCPECGHPLKSADVKFCPNCGNRVIPPATVEPTEIPPLSASERVPTEKTEERSASKRCTAALLLGAGTFVFAVLTCIARILAVDLRALRLVATGAFFLAPLACCFGILGIAVCIKHKKRGLPSAIIGLLLGLFGGLATGYLLLGRILGVAWPF